MRHGFFVRYPTHNRLKQLGGALKSKRDPAQLRKREVKGVLQYGINGGNYRLDRIVQQMGKADG